MCAARLMIPRLMLGAAFSGLLASCAPAPAPAPSDPFYLASPSSTRPRANPTPDLDSGDDHGMHAPSQGGMPGNMSPGSGSMSFGGGGSPGTPPQ